MEWINVEDKLPENGQHVLIYINDDATSISGGNGRARVFAVYFEVIKQKLQPFADIGNHKLPYIWNEFGPGMWFGHDANYWMPIPNHPKV
jgi:hypothetical protein